MGINRRYTIPLIIITLLPFLVAGLVYQTVPPTMGYQLRFIITALVLVASVQLSFMLGWKYLLTRVMELSEMTPTEIRLTLLLSVIREFNIISDLDELLRHVTERAAQNLGYPNITIYMYDAGLRKMTLTASGDPAMWEFIDREVDVTPYNSLVGRALYLKWVQQREETDLTEVPPELVADLAIPLVKGEDVYGVMALRNEGKRLEDNDILILTSLASILSTAIANVQHTASVSRTLTRTRKMQALSQDVTANMSLGELLDEIVRVSVDVLEVKAAILFLFGKDRKDEIRAVAWKGVDEGLINDYNLLLRDDIVREVAVSGQPARYPYPLHREKPPLSTFPGVKAELAVPVGAGSELIGVLDVQTDSEHCFDDEEASLLMSLAAQAGVAITNVRAYQAELQRRRIAESIQEIADALSGTLNLRDLLERILDQLKETVPYDRASILLRKEDEEVLYMAASRGFPPSDSSEPFRVKIEDSLVFNEIYKTSEPLVIADCETDPRWVQVEGLPLNRSWLGAPLMTKKEAIGMISIGKEEAGAYGQAEAELALNFAGQAAVALQNARLYDELVNAYKHLERLDKTKSDFINIAAHELRTPITVIQGYTSMMLTDAGIKENVFLSQLLDGILSGMNRLYEIVNSMLDVSKLDSEAFEFHLTPTLIGRIVGKIGDELQDPLKERQLQLEIEDMGDLPEVQADVDGLKKVFNQLLLNAIKFTPDGGTIIVSGRAFSENDGGEPADFVEVLVRDTGIGIDPEHHDLIFEKFYQTGELALHSSGKTKFKGAGPGLGLAIARGIIEAHGGKIWVESDCHDEEKCPGSTFHVVLPVDGPPA